MIRLVGLIASTVLLAAPLLADDVLPERRITVWENTDFFGGDVGSVFDTTRDACAAACLADGACQAFTFNTRSDSCFLKSTIEDQQGYIGALSGRLRDVAQPLRRDAALRAERLGALRSADLSAALQEARQLPFRHPRRGLSAVELAQAARASLSQGNPGQALRDTGEALGIADSAALWTDYARLALDLPEDDPAARQDLRARALSAAINGYLRAADPAGQAEALIVLATAFERNRRGRDSIDALRLAFDLAPSGSTRAALDRALGLFGFRVTDTEVESDLAAPRICVEFSEPLIASGQDYALYVRTDAGGIAVEAEDRRLCLGGLDHGTRYTLTLRSGLPAASGEVLQDDVDLALYVRDRAPLVRFPGRGYVLPAGGTVAVPIVTVNLDSVALELRRMSDRNLLRAMQEDLFARPVPNWRQDLFRDALTEPVWQGDGVVESALNRDVTTRLPLGDAVGDLAPGIYALQARIPGADPYDEPAATQWFVVSDIGLLSLQGSDGLHVFARSLSSADAKSGIALTLLSQANAELGRAVTDAEGRVTFGAGLTRGVGAAAPALVVARDGEADMAFLPLTGPAFDLDDRGVEGRDPAGPMDVFLTTDRGIYRAGDPLHATALLRDAQARAIEGVPLTAILSRPDGVEYARALSTDAPAGGHVFALGTAPEAPRGTWRLAIHAEPDAPALATQRLLVEDFLPERLDMDLTLPDGPLAPDARPTLEVDARYLFGAPAADLPVAVTLRVDPQDQVDAYPGATFGLHDQQPGAELRQLPALRTGADGRAQATLTLPEIAATQPARLTVTAAIREGSGRPVERQETRTLLPDTPMIGILSRFDGTLPENSEATFGLIATDGEIQARWRLSKVETRFQWYALDGRWDWEPVTTRTLVAEGEQTLGPTPAEIAVPVDWGTYELLVERQGAGPYLAASVAFSAGWYAPEGLTDTPDLLQVSLDAARYAPGDTARLRIVPRDAGQVLVHVVADRVIDSRVVAVGTDPVTVDLPVIQDWGQGAYVLATHLRPADTDQGPARAIGLAHAGVEPGAAALGARFEVPDRARPRAPLGVGLRVDGVAEGDTAFATIAAVDLGVLNLTGFDAPDPSAHYFGQRKLGIGLRDLYGRLIDGRSGAMGQVRSGGDAARGLTMQAPPPDAVVARFAGPLTVRDGVAQVDLDLPAFNGTLRLMAVVWSRAGVGQASSDVLVRDPIVAQVSLPRFLAPGDRSRMLVELTHADGPTGAVEVELSADGLAIATPPPARVALDQGQTRRLSVPIVAGDTGLARVTLALVTPDGTRLEQDHALPIRRLDPEIHRTSRFELAPGGTFTFGADVFAGLGDGSATLSAGAFGRIDVAGLLAGLDRYPYGCSEQVTSRALPLLYLGQLARSLGIDDGDDVAQRLRDAVAAVLARQDSAGSFGMWRADGGGLWLDAYVTDFLSRARSEGVAVPDAAFTRALDNLRNRVNYAADFDSGGEGLAYALYVLAREGAAAMGDLRYYADVKGRAFATPLARAQIGAALASYGDTARADAMFGLAAAGLGSGGDGWRDDYGTALRDRAGVLTLAIEAGSDAVDRAALAASLQSDTRLSTQEAAWSLLAAHALADAPDSPLTVDGAALDGPLLQLRAADTEAAPIAIGNPGDTPALLTLTTFGVPDTPRPAGGEGYAIERQYFTLDGLPADTREVAQGTRLVTLLTVQPFDDTGARLMIDDPLPAGFEIDNPALLRSGDIAALDWLDVVEDPQNVEFRDDRFLAAVDWRSDDAFRLAYIVRAVSPGDYRHPAASVEDMYRPRFRAHTATGAVSVLP
ncbi:alpha-2-macroglobulin family protein [Maribius pontilimi]|uniref:Alpha-2-macroglobulin family protein n=1 Tax=Palleronia pontilimi TaxID=1964209 RepID=A0A934IIR8_9RHOB|nr:MG2 domain-containing protein [Palleronia pontilimi]MBJ3763325.1 alpha-2-macroglobulin family protein [Palleronia pontilimi]